MNEKRGNWTSWDVLDEKEKVQLGGGIFLIILNNKKKGD